MNPRVLLTIIMIGGLGYQILGFGLKIYTIIIILFYLMCLLGIDIIESNAKAKEKIE